MGPNPDELTVFVGTLIEQIKAQVTENARPDTAVALVLDKVVDLLRQALNARLSLPKRTLNNTEELKACQSDVEQMVAEELEQGPVAS